MIRARKYMARVAVGLVLGGALVYAAPTEYRDAARAAAEATAHTITRGCNVSR